MSKRYDLCGDNISLFRENDYIESKKEVIKSCDFEGIIIFINMGDKIEFKSLLDEYEACPKKLHTHIDFVNGYTEGTGYSFEDTYTQYISLMIKRDYLLDILSKSKKSKPLIDFFNGEVLIKNFMHNKINPKTQSLAYEILNTPYKDNLDKLFIESKSLELLHTELNNLLTSNYDNDSHIKFSNQDKEAIYHAKKILMTNTSNPPSLKELSYLVKINEFKLKVGFNRFFNQTPYSISVEYRLEEAKKLLEKSEMNINEIALKVGYKYAQSFSSAFLKRYGVRPKDIMKTRKYYY